jgi:hypothetical protein
MQKQQRRLRFELDERSLVPVEQLDVRGIEMTEVALTHPVTGTVTHVVIPKVPAHPACPCCRCGLGGRH